MENSQRGFRDRESELVRDLLLDRLVRKFGSERQIASEELVGVHPPEHHLGVGHRRLRAAAVVAGWARIGAGRARADIESARLVDIGDRTAAGANGNEVEDRKSTR